MSQTKPTKRANTLTNRNTNRIAIMGLAMIKTLWETLWCISARPDREMSRPPLPTKEKLTNKKIRFFFSIPFLSRETKLVIKNVKLLFKVLYQPLLVPVDPLRPLFLKHTIWNYGSKSSIYSRTCPGNLFLFWNVWPGFQFLVFFHVCIFPLTSLSVSQLLLFGHRSCIV